MSRNQIRTNDIQQKNYSNSRNINNNNSNMRLRNPILRDYFEKEDIIKNEGYIDEIKI